MIESEKEKTNIENLGNKKLDLKIDYPEVRSNTEIYMLNGTIKKFICYTCKGSYYKYCDRDVHVLEVEALNKNKDKIKQIVDYAVSLNANSSELNHTTAQDGDNCLIYDFWNRNWFDANEIYRINTSEFKKTYVILQLIEWGVNPFEIRRCLKSKGDNDFNWKKFMEYVMDNRDIFQKILDNYYYADYQEFSQAIRIIRVMYLFEPLFKNPSDNLKPFEVSLLFDSFYSSYKIINFILRYLDELDDNQQNNKIKKYLLEIPEGYLCKNFLEDNNNSLVKQISKNCNKKENAQVCLSDVMVGFIYFDFYKKDFGSDFWDLIGNLNNDPVMIAFFVLIAMLKISFTSEQMNFIAQKIKNQQVIDKLREINLSLDYKIEYINQYGLKRRVKIGRVTAFLDYGFFKMSRGIGYLGAALYDGVLCMPAMAIGGGIGFVIAFLVFTVLSFTLWTTTFWIIAAILSGAVALLFLWHCIGKYGDYLKLKFRKFADGMQKFYNNGKIVHWLESYNIKNPTNEIGVLLNTGILSNVEENNVKVINNNSSKNSGHYLREGNNNKVR